jgi:cytidyltransferase-like protein
MRTVVIYPGRFQPFHQGHKASYDHLAKQFDEVYVVTSGVQAPVTSPFSFDDKLVMITRTGIPSGRVVQVRNPYQAQEITKDIDNPGDTVLIFAVSEKDMGEDARFKFGVKKDGSPSYMQPYPAGGRGVKPMTDHAYVLVTPTVNFQVKGRNANSASEIRKLYTAGNDADRTQIITDLYGEADAGLKDIFDARLLPAQQARDFVYKQKPVDANVLDTPAPVQRENRQKLSRILESIQTMESRAAQAYAVFNEDLAANYISEKDKTESYWPPKRI